MNAKVIYFLTPAGQKASILAGGNGQAEQVLAVSNDDQNFAKVVEFGSVSGSGEVVWELSGRYSDSLRFDLPQTLAQLVAHQEAKIEAARKEADAEKAKITANTLAVLTNRTTDMKANVSAEAKDEVTGCVGTGTIAYPNPDWPYPKDESVIASPEAKVWLAEIEQGKVAAKAKAEELAKTDLAAKIAAKTEAEAKAKKNAEIKAERRRQLGVPEDAVLLTIEDGALASVPPNCWESHSRGKNWLAKISVNASKPGGLERDFAAMAKGDSYYILPDFQAGDPVEFGADYYSGGGRKSPTRWYGYVVKIGTVDDVTYLCLAECSTGKAACKQGAAYAKENGAMAIEDAVAAGIAKINSEGGIVPSAN